MRQLSPPKTHCQRSVVFAAFDDLIALDLIGPLEAFSVARRHPSLTGTDPYQLRVVSERGGMITAGSGLQIATEAASALDEAAIDTLIVPGGACRGEPESAKGLRPWLQQRAPTARRVCSVCTGAFILGGAGLLDGRQATTHWLSLELLAATHPEADVRRGPIFVRDGNLWTSAGVTAGIDLALALIEDDHGHHVAMDVARVLVVFLKRPGNQGQFSVPLETQSGADKRFSELLARISANLSGDLSVEALAAEVGMTPRTFARTFVKQLGQTPAKVVEGIRLEAARRALEEGSLSLKEIARRTGFGDEQGLRRAFRRWSGITPSAYRDRFAPALA